MSTADDIVLAKGQTLHNIAEAIRELKGEGDSATYSLTEMNEILNNMSGANFSIVGGTSVPVNPMENTIWVETDAEITDWEFSNAQPESPIEGMVWISTIYTSEVSINIFTIGEYVIHPFYSQQYINNAWVDKTAKSYQSGEWVDWYTWNGQLYYQGNEYIPTTGGWKGRGWKYQSTDTGTVIPTIEKKVNSMIISCEPGSGYRGGVCEVVNNIDLTNFTTLTVVIKSAVAVGNYSAIDIYVGDRNGTLSTSTWKARTAILSAPGTVGAKTFTVNVSSINGAWDIFFNFRCRPANASNANLSASATVEVESVILS